MMPSLILPPITPAVVAAHNTKKSCYVTIGHKVYDMTTFLPDHPGGEDLILDYAGQDIASIMSDEISHSHGESAFEILEDYLIGTLTTSDSTTPQPANGKLPSSSASDRDSNDINTLLTTTDPTADFKAHAFIDLRRPMFPQLLLGDFKKEFYLEQVHRPRHYRGGASAPLFGNFLEPLSKTPWWVVPCVWLPCVAYGLWCAYVEFGYRAGKVAGLFAIGGMVWTLLEYVLHRFLFHLDE